MQTLLDFARRCEPEIIAFARELVECESPSDDATAVNRLVDLIAARLAGRASVRAFPGGRYGKHLRCEFRLPGPRKRNGVVLALGHTDTVWPLGTLARMPFRQAGGRLWGPGVLDMKSGIVFFVFAMRALAEMDRPVRRRVVLLLNSDEEVGSPSSRAITEREARASDAVLVLEPGTGLEGRLKTARKGVGGYVVEVEGRASHSGVDFAAGASAIHELARQVQRIAAFTRLERGITVNVGLISGGSRTNVVAESARADVDVRVPRLRDVASLERKFRGLRPFDRRCTITVSGGLNRPPMERSAGAVRLLRLAQRLGRDLGVELGESSTGGGSDGNFTAALGVPTLDGLGGVGEGAHALSESILVSRIADRTALLARLVETI
jgi:glutamate carboxypeptidase